MPEKDDGEGESSNKSDSQAGEQEEGDEEEGELRNRPEEDGEHHRCERDEHPNEGSERKSPGQEIRILREVVVLQLHSASDSVPEPRSSSAAEQGEGYTDDERLELRREADQADHRAGEKADQHSNALIAWTNRDEF